ncbi:MAG: NfeD family protein [Thermoplasmata archaeon]
MVIDYTIGILVVIIGIVLLAFELVHPGALLFIPGSILLVAGFLYLFFPTYLLDSPYGPIAIVVVAVLSTLIEIFYYRWVAPTHNPLSTTTHGLVGEVGVVTAAIVPDTLKGKVRVRSEIWSAKASVPIPAGAHVRVVKGEGVAVSVELVDPPPGG